MKNIYNIVGRKVKYYFPSTSRFIKGEELIIKGINIDKKKLVVENKHHEEYLLEPKYVRYLNNMIINIF